MYTGFSNPTPENPVPCGRYELLERIGYGGMAEVFRARLTGPSGFAKTVVIKRILPRLAGDNLVVRMFIEEAKIAAAADHDNIATVFELGVADDGKFFMVMEYIQGVDLELLLGAANRRSLRIPTWFTIHAICEVLEALSYVHGLTDEEGKPRNVIHRDATPSNIFVSNLGQVKLSDFGVADYEGKSPTTQAGQLKGKLAYMSPEQLNNKLLDHRADLFTIGVVLWEALTHQRLFGAMSEVQAMLAICDGDRKKPSAVNTEIPVALDEIALKALKVDRDDRYQTADAFQSDLLEVLHELRGPVRRSDVREVVRMLTGRQAPNKETSGAMLALSPRASSSFMVPLDLEAEKKPVVSEESAPAVPAFDDTYIKPEEAAKVDNETLVTVDEASSPELAEEVAQLRAIVNEAPEYDDPMDVTLRDDSIPNLALASQAIPEPVILEPGEKRYFFVRKQGSPTSDKLDFAAANHKLATFTEQGIKASISVDDKYFIDADEFAQLTSQDHIGEMSAPPTNVTVVGTTESRRLPAVFAVLARDRATGTLAIANMLPGSEDWYEVRIKDGRPTRVKTNVLSMQLPNVLASGGWVPADRLPDLLHGVVELRRPLGQIATERGLTMPTSLEIAQARAVELFRWANADYTFNVDVNAPTNEPHFARSVLALLPTLVKKSLNSAQIFERMIPHLEIVHEPSWRFGEAIEEMALDDADRAAAECFERQHTIREIVEARIDDRERMLQMALLLIEADLLLPVIE